jgi:hypothetical protein
VRLRGVERGQHPVGQIDAAFGGGREGVRHRLGDASVRHHVGLHRPTVAAAMARLPDAAFSGVRGDGARCVHDRDLTNR